MTLNGKRDGFTLEDFRACERSAMMKRGRASAIVEEVREAVRRWQEFAGEARIQEIWINQIRANHRLEF
jgi:serine/threonine-protein kinase HipA